MTSAEVSSTPDVSRPSSRKPAVGKRPHPSRPGAPLSARQIQVLRLIADGHTDQQIADRFHIGVDTAKKLVQRVYTKLEVNCRAAAVNAGWEKNYLGDTPPHRLPVDAGDALTAIADLIARHGGEREWAAMRLLCSERDTAKRNAQLLAKFGAPAPSWLHVTPGSRGNATSRVAGA